MDWKAALILGTAIVLAALSLGRSIESTRWVAEYVEMPTLEQQEPGRVFLLKTSTGQICSSGGEGFICRVKPKDVAD